MSAVPRDLASLTLAEFTARLGERFRVASHGAAIELELVAADALGQASSAGGRRPFSLIFRGPRSSALTQRIHRIEGPRSGALEIFLVPIEPDRDGLRYEAVFV